MRPPPTAVESSAALRTAPAVECRGVTREFAAGDSRALVLRGVDVAFPLGQISMLVGPSGCGKTTLLSIIAGLLSRTDGEMTVLGQDPARMAGAALVAFRRRNLGFIFQQFNLLPALSAAENAAVPLLAAGTPLRRAVDRAREFLARLKLEARADLPINRLSGGEQQRVAIARALIHEPRLVLCDEPTSALDAATGHAVMELLASVAVRPDRAVVVVTHDSRVYEFAGSIAHMDDGRVTHVEQRAARSADQTAHPPRAMPPSVAESAAPAVAATPRAVEAA